MKRDIKIKNMAQFLILIILTGYFSFGIVNSSFAFNQDKSPDVIISINSDGIKQDGSLFDSGQLYPSTVEQANNGIGSISGVIRIVNNYRNNITIDNLAIGLNKDDMVIKNNFEPDTVYNSFINNVKLKIVKGVLFDFDKTIMNYTSLKDIIYDASKPGYNGFTLNPKDRFNIPKGNSVDLKYTLHVSGEAGNELQAVTAIMPIYINVFDFKVPDDNDGNDDDNNGGSSDRDDEIVQITEQIPTGVPHWAHDCIITLLNHHVITGYPHPEMTIEDYHNGTVDPVKYVNEAVLPERHITRAESAVLVGKALGLEKSNATFTGYLDKIPDWARGYIISTTKEGIFEGYPFKLFKANNYITREEMIAVLTRAYEIKLENDSIELPFIDKGDISNWAMKNVKAGYEKEIIVGYPDNYYRPKNNITRAEAFTIICKLMGFHDEHTKLPENN